MFDTLRRADRSDSMFDEIYEAAFNDELEKIASIGDAFRKVFGYHDLNEISNMTQIPKSDVKKYYHGLRVPNRMLYSRANVAADIKNIWSKREAYNKTRVSSGLFKTKPGSKEEAAILKKNKKNWDKMLNDVVTTQRGLVKKYRNIKN